MSPTTTSVETPVLIVGAGPTGACAALELARHGTASVVIDRWADVYPQPRAVHLDDEVLRILDRLGVAERFATISRPGGGLRLVDAGLRVLGEFPREGVSPTSGFTRASMFDQPDLEGLLRDRLAETPEVTLLGGHEVTAIEQRGPGRVRVRARASGTGEEQVLDAEVLLGCDGANSLVRRSIGATLTDLGFEQRWLVVDIRTRDDLRQWEGVHQVCDSTRAATYMRIGPDRYRWEFQLLEGETADDFAALEALAPLIAPWTADLDVSSWEVIRSAEYTFRAAIADRWRSGRIFLLGDAAHLTPPFIGQGMGAGVRDASNLGWKVAGFLTGALSADVLDTYEPERSRHARTMIDTARLLGTVMTRGGRTGDTLRGAVVPVLNRARVVRRRFIDSATPALGGSSLVASSRGDRLAGQLCPNTVDGRRVVDDLIGPGWALVTAAAPSPSDRRELEIRGCAVVETPARRELAAWLRAGRATAALVRPDRTTAASGHDVSALVARVASLITPARTEVSA
ncbi:MAG: bifunctional 3-(3-hydroxy-phenyl)propionate/3-hydroxycinnamic acid hydroxylase [Aeromicrobium sp.]|uniref:bifunctional 3-(3-hydroxy-phenyl)propionate/3-hydroxycinnamic acid hydroxylase MhpA n=1 Tax=Aeromicrobium sp. TaxID=1871063 RepID=UPI002628040D|nr:bifunctional 3-(3-hydroxy-phenyl)propionate/3-hydroxycinnamic acid hydroxylase [Aeromicrobium sp.]MDF1706192.1 bifunctional 3-(3-hydroxy-phenyl)propionate/3-hydroxycinnamic acid hydroxylase [Aeromicrobium sp.]